MLGEEGSLTSEINQSIKRNTVLLPHFQSVLRIVICKTLGRLTIVVRGLIFLLCALYQVTL